MGQITRSSSRDETANVNFFYDDIVHALQNNNIYGSQGKFAIMLSIAKIRLAVEFESSSE